MQTTTIPAVDIKVGQTVVFPDTGHTAVVYNWRDRHGRRFVTFEGERPTHASFPLDSMVTVQA